jgi:hypothetical protein
VLAEQVLALTDAGGAAAEEAVCALDDVAILAPRGRFNVEMHLGFLKLSGQTQEFKIRCAACRGWVGVGGGVGVGVMRQLRGLPRAGRGLVWALIPAWGGGWCVCAGGVGAGRTAALPPAFTGLHAHWRNALP